MMAIFLARTCSSSICKAGRSNEAKALVVSSSSELSKSHGPHERAGDNLPGHRRGRHHGRLGVKGIDRQVGAPASAPKNRGAYFRPEPWPTFSLEVKNRGTSGRETRQIHRFSMTNC